MSFSDKVVIVTGAGSGIGVAAAVRFAAEGARVALVDLNETKLGNVAQQCAQNGAQALFIKADINNDHETKTIVKKTIGNFGQLDVLINNAGIIKPRGTLIERIILGAFDTIMRTNLRAAIHLTSLAVPHLIKTKGNVINTSSVFSHLTPKAPQHAPYSIFKATIDHFTRCAALELAASGVRVNSVNSGPMKTDILENSGSKNPGAVWEDNRQKTALKRLGEPGEIADLMIFWLVIKQRALQDLILPLIMDIRCNISTDSSILILSLTLCRL